MIGQQNEQVVHSWNRGKSDGDGTMMIDTIDDSHLCESRKMINGVSYIVKSYFKEDARETAEQKIIRLIRECVATEIKNSEDAVLRAN